ncbi:Diaminobutyrate--2-oxoglutarate aminotransferase [compost metagenome]|jgi:diaminobutyrate-2-oxoglutarate transaminase
MTQHPELGDVRGRGLMLGVELVEPSFPAGMPQPAAPGLASAVQAECLRHALIIELGGRHGSVVRFLPPLIITARQIDRVFEIFSASLRAALHAQGEAAFRTNRSQT